MESKYIEEDNDGEEDEEEEIISKIDSDIDSNSSNDEDESIEDESIEDIKNELNDTNISKILSSSSDTNNDSDSDSDDNKEYFQKFDQELNNNYIIDNHQEDLEKNYNEILTLSKIVKDEQGNIIDVFHKTNPILSKYEKTRILGLRTKQLNDGAPPLIKLSENIIDSYLIAEIELKEKKLPFIIQRPIPNNDSEYWFLEDLEIL